MGRGSQDAGRRALRLLKNALILYFALSVCEAIEPYLRSLPNLTIGGLTLSGANLITGISLIFVIYFGYFILVDVVFFLNLASKMISTWLVGEEASRIRMMAYDLAVIIALVLLYALVTPLIEGLGDFGKPLSTGIQIALLAIGVLIVYHLAKQVYYLLKNRIDRFVKRFLERGSPSGDDAG